MRTSLLACVGLLVAAEGCGAGAASYVKSDTTLGKVVVYRNGVAYFERVADVANDQLALKVPSDKIDDFLKSLTVVDAKTGLPTPVSYPTAPAGGSGLVDLTLRLGAGGAHRVKLTYVTEAPAWKPTYRVALGKDGKVDVQAWAIVDNTSGEDWTSVKLGVGSSSALSFRFDLRSVHGVARETLHSDTLFAQAPPLGGSVYGASPAPPRVVAEFADDTLAGAIAAAPVAQATQADARRTTATGEGFGSGSGRLSGAGAASVGPSAAYKSGSRPTAPLEPAVAAARALQNAGGSVLVEGFAAPQDADKESASLDRAQKLRDQLVRQGLDPARIVAVGRGDQAGRNGGVRVVEAPRAPAKDPTTPAEGPSDPIGTAHFDSPSVMTVPHGTSAMISMLQSSTEGEVVYLYDAESVRGNATYPFRSVRLRNPTDSQLESGPVTVYGEGRFIGEGLCEPIPAHAVAFVPFALDRQVVVETKQSERDEIARILTVQRGVMATEIKHTRRSAIALHNRAAEPVVVYVRHTVAAGYTLTVHPERDERVGNAHLFRVEVPAGGTTEVALEEATPVRRTTDVRTGPGLDMVRVYLSSGQLTGKLKDSVERLVALSHEVGNAQQKIVTLRDQQGEYRQRMDELHAQIVTLRAVKSGGALMRNLEAKLTEVSDKLSRATIDTVAMQETLMIARVHLEDAIAELSLDGAS